MEDKQTTAQDQKWPALQSWSPADSKLLVITFIATVTANLVTVLFVGLAIALAHGFHPKKSDPWSYVIPIAVTAMGVIGAGVLIAYVRHELNTRDNLPDIKWIRTSLTVSKIALIALAACLAVIGFLEVLVWVGLAAGVR